MTLAKLNSLSQRDAETFFKLCCSSKQWMKEMVGRRPFTSVGELYAVADKVWFNLDPTGWKEAFAHHPKIGDIKELRRKFASTAEMAEGEQSGVRQASEKILKELKEGNDLYEAKFGFIFIVCASGKSADEMLSLLKQRLNNYPSDEINIAAAEQAKITRLRLEKNLTSEPSISNTP